MSTVAESILKQQEKEEGLKDIYQERVAYFEMTVAAMEKKTEITTAAAIEARVVEELNKTHAVVHTDQYHILTEKIDPLHGGIDFTLETRQSLVNMYENQMIDIRDKKPKSKAKIWLSHPNRRQYDGIMFDPSTNGHKQGQYNLWRGFAIKPKQGNCGLFKEHLKGVICAGNQEAYSYVWNWMSSLAQKPDKLLPALLIKGEQGVGKNTVADTFGTIFGPHYSPLDNLDQLVGRFNFHLKNAVLVYGNEALWGGDKTTLGKLKASITDPFCFIECKGKDLIKVKNFKHYIFASNEDWPVHLDRDDRRFFVLKVNNVYKDDRVYFAELYNEINNGGAAALLYELLATDLSSFDPWQFPRNNEGFEIKMRSADSTEKYIYQVLYDGGFDVGSENQCGEWENSSDSYEISFRDIRRDYVSWCSYQNQNRAIQDDGPLGKSINRLIPKAFKGRSRKNGRKSHYRFPPLKEARQDFQKAYKVGVEIWD